MEWNIIPLQKITKNLRFFKKTHPVYICIETAKVSVLLILEKDWGTIMD